MINITDIDRLCIQYSMFILSVLYNSLYITFEQDRTHALISYCKFRYGSGCFNYNNIVECLVFYNVDYVMIYLA